MARTDWIKIVGERPGPTTKLGGPPIWKFRCNKLIDHPDGKPREWESDRSKSECPTCHLERNRRWRQENRLTRQEQQRRRRERIKREEGALQQRRDRNAVEKDRRRRRGREERLGIPSPETRVDQEVERRMKRSRFMVITKLTERSRSKLHPADQAQFDTRVKFLMLLEDPWDWVAQVLAQTLTSPPTRYLCAQTSCAKIQEDYEINLGQATHNQETQNAEHGPETNR